MWKKTVRKTFKGVIGVMIKKVFVVITVTVIVVWIDVFKMYSSSSWSKFQCINNENSISIFQVTKSRALITLLVTFKWLLSF